MPRKGKSKQSITDPVEVINLAGCPSPLAAKRPIPPELIANRWEVECRGDRIDTVEDLFRLLCRAREYLVEADRQLRYDLLTSEELAGSQAWYAEMDAGNEWTGLDAHAHVDAAQSIMLLFDANPAPLLHFDSKHFIGLTCSNGLQRSRRSTSAGPSSASDLMSSHSGKAGMGSHKHAISGVAGRSPRFKQNRQREANSEAAKKAETNAKKKNIDLYGSVQEAMQKHKIR